MNAFDVRLSVRLSMTPFRRQMSAQIDQYFLLSRTPWLFVSI